MAPRPPQRTTVGGGAARPAAGLLLAAATLLLFLVWSNSFVANSYLLGTDGGPVRLDWLSLTVVRFLTAGSLAALWCLLRHRREALALLRSEGILLVPCGILGGPLYNFALTSAQQHGVPAPVASLTTALVPLFILLLSALFLGERLTRRRALGLVVSLAGMGVVAAGKGAIEGTGYRTWIAVAALAPFSWAIYSVISKPRMARISPLLWTYLAVGIGGLGMAPLLPGRVWKDVAALDAPGWAAVLYLVLPCTVLGFAVWTWLLRHLPASTVGLTVFLNPPLTTASKAALTLLAPATFAFRVGALEWIGGAVVLAGLALAVLPGSPWRPRRGRPPAETLPERPGTR